MNERMRRYWYIIWIINGLLIAGLWWFYQYSLAAGEARAYTLRHEVARSEENRRLLKERKNLVTAWQPYRDQIDTFFFTRDRLVAWLEFLEQNARTNKIIFEVSSLDEKQGDKNPHLQATIKGANDQTLRFLSAIQSGPYGISIQEGTMRKGLAQEYITQITLIFYEASF